MTRLHELNEMGQSVWYDNISRGMLNSGEIQKLIDQGVRGMTSNPTIFDKAISGSTDYDEDLRRLAKNDSDPQAIFEQLAYDDIRRAADMLRPIYDETDGADGLISLEVSPDLAYNTEETLETVRRYVKAVDRPNLMIKIPATTEGIPAIKQAISEGYNINITLMFSLDHYEAVTEAYISGLEELSSNGGDISTVASVASFFLSRVDTKIDKQLEEKGNTELQGKIAVANAKLTYARFQEIFNSDRWKKLADQGAKVQRPLWASTSTKNPDYPDTMYVDNLIGNHTVNTVPTETLEAILDHAVIRPQTVEEGIEEAREQIQELAEVGIDLDQATEELQEEGVKKFADSYNSLLESIAQKVPA